MLPKENRLKKTKDIEGVFKRGKGVKGNFLFLKTVKNSIRTSRFAFIVSKKVANKSSARNKIKRALREQVKTLLPLVSPGFDVVLVVLRGVSKEKLPETKEEVKSLFKKAKLI